jgi:hypothetical protein
MTSTSKPGTPRSRSSSSVRVTPVGGADAVGDQGDARRVVAVAGELALLLAEKAVAGAYGTAGMHASKTSVAAAPQSPPAPSDAIASTRPTATWSLRSWKWRARRKAGCG